MLRMSKRKSVLQSKSSKKKKSKASPELIEVTATPEPSPEPAPDSVVEVKEKKKKKKSKSKRDKSQYEVASGVTTPSKEKRGSPVTLQLSNYRLLAQDNNLRIVSPVTVRSLYNHCGIAVQDGTGLFWLGCAG